MIPIELEGCLSTEMLLAPVAKLWRRRKDVLASNFNEKWVPKSVFFHLVFWSQGNTFGNFVIFFIHFQAKIVFERNEIGSRVDRY